MNVALRIILSIFVWLARIVIFLPFAVIGIPLVYLLAHSKWCAPRYSPKFKRIVLQWRTPWLVYPWTNLEDGIDGLRGGDPAQKWWSDRTAAWSPQKRIFVWAALRNPVDSLRWVPILNPELIPRTVRFIGMDHEPAKGEGGWYFAWMGPYSCIRYETKTRRFWLGWKIKPQDAKGVGASDPRLIRCDFAMQFKRISS